MSMCTDHLHASPDPSLAMPDPDCPDRDCSADFGPKQDPGIMADAVAGSLRLAIVGPIPPPEGGMANQTRQLMRLLQCEGLSVELVPVNPPYRPAWIARLRWVRALFRLLPYLGNLWRTMRRVDAVHIMASSGWSWFLFAVPPLIAAYLKGVPSLVNYRGGHAEHFLERFGPLAKPWMRLASAIVVPSGFLQAVFSQQGLAVRVIPNIIDAERFIWREPTRGMIEAPRVIVTRNLEPIYDIATAIRTFALVREQFPGATLAIAGSGPQRTSLEQLVAELGLQDCVIFTGSLDRDGMARLYAAADVMLNTSLVDNMPNSLLEALASGIPVVSSHVGGIPYIVRHGETALLVPPGDPDTAAVAVCRVLSDRDLAVSLARRGRDCALRYSWQSVRRQWLDQYAELLSERR